MYEKFNTTLIQQQKEFNIEILHLFEDDNKKYILILGREIYQAIRLNILNSTYQFKQHENVINMFLSGYQKENRNNYKQKDRNIIVELYKDLDDCNNLTKISANNYKKIDFNNKIEKQTHLCQEQKDKLLFLWKHHENLFEGRV